MGKIISANTFRMYHSNDSYRYPTYLPKKCVLYGGLDKYNLEVFANLTDAPKIDNDAVISFETKSFRYYKLVVTQTHAANFNYLCYRYAKFSLAYPMATPSPSRTQYPGTIATYIDKEFTDSVGTDQIQAGVNNTNQISGCRFTNIHDTPKNYYIRIGRDTAIFDNVFENTEFITEPKKGGIFWNDHPGQLNIVNCQFIRISGKGGEGYILTSAHIHIINVDISQCDFIDCGQHNGNLQLVSLFNKDSSIIFNDCKFIFSSPSRTCGVFQSKNNQCKFEYCEFVGCNENTILLSKDVGANEQPIGTFSFRNNKVTNNKGKFLNINLLNSHLNITNNVFDTTTISTGYFIQILSTRNDIELVGNTFSHITSSGTQTKGFGGSAVCIESTQSTFTLRYNSCTFIDVTNNAGSHPNCQGGAFQYGFSDSSNMNCNIEIINCEFKSNKAKQHGGAIAIRTAKSVTIRDCIFKFNIANNVDSKAELLFTNHYNDNDKGVGGGIYLNPTFNVNGSDYQMSSITITGCTFKDNRAYQGYSIYIAGEESDTVISITGNTFDGNSSSEGSPDGFGIIAVEILSIDKEDIISSNTFSNIGTSLQFTYSHPDNLSIVTQSPTPERTQYPGTNTSFINKDFQGTIYNIDQVHTNRSNIKQISGCHFTDINETNRNYYFKIENDILIFDNIFENTQILTQEKAGVFWIFYNGKITLTNCSFRRINGKGGEGYVLTSNSAIICHVTFEQCEFTDCGRNFNNYQLSAITLLHKDSSAKFYDCRFTYTVSSINCAIIHIRNNDCTFNNCNFAGCGAGTISLSKDKDADEQPIGTFIFTNNQVKNNQGKIISSTLMLTKPIIENNTFESTTLNEGYYIDLPNNQAVIELNNNTFTQITSSGTQDKGCGGAGIFLESTNSEFTIKYNDCKFIDIINNEASYPNCQGGAIQYGFSDSSNMNCHIEIINCEFRGSKAKQHGGGIAIRTAKSVTISNCKFYSNLAHNVNSNGELLFTNNYEIKTNGFGGGIYLNPTFNLNGEDYQMSNISISGCTFKDNVAYQGYAIYIAGEESNAVITINSNTFNGDSGSEGSPIGGIVTSEILSVNKKSVINSNTFTNFGINERFNYAYPDGTTIIKPRPTQYPNTNTTYINKNFIGTVDTSQIQAGENNIKQISGCRFTDITDTIKNYYIRIGGETIIFDNIFENTKLTPASTTVAGIIWYDYSGKFTISNCKFIRISGRGGEGYVITSNRERIVHIIIDRCDFIDCGQHNGNLQLISLFNKQSSIKIYDCNFIFNSPDRICGVLQILNNDCVIDNCQFIGCAANTILLSKNAINDDQAVGTFEFTNNQVKNNHGGFLNISRLLQKPIIENNAFENAALSNGHFIQIAHNQAMIELNHNTFSHITNSENNVIININQMQNNESIIFTDNFFNDCCCCIRVEQQNGLVAINNCNFNNINQNPVSFNLIEELILEKSNFENCEGKVEITNTISSAKIDGCIFSDCYYLSNDASVITISNQKSIVINNIINFTSNEKYKSIGGLHITTHGNIEVIHNQFININGGINIIESNQNLDQTGSILTFNYNTIENVEDTKFGIFNIIKINLFEFNHNIIRNCTLNNEYSSQIKLLEGNAFNDIFVITNLTLLNCYANTVTDDSLSLWLLFEDPMKGIFKLKDCTFRNNSVISISNERIFESDNSMITNKELITENCTYIDNRGSGALSIQSYKQSTILNCTFINNEADLDGGAIYIHPKVNNNQYNVKIQLNEELTIVKFDNCSFLSNKADRSGGALAIQTQLNIYIFNCTFDGNKANCNSESIDGRGGSIFIRNLNDNSNQYSDDSEIRIENCIFNKNMDLSCNSIYLSGEVGFSTIKISGNDFREEKSDNNNNSSIFFTDICALEVNQIVEENIFRENENNQIVDCLPSIDASSFFSKSDNFSPSEEFFTASKTFLIPVARPVSKTITFSVSYSLTYVNRKSVSFSLSLISSNTYEMSFDEMAGTYMMVQTNANFYVYLPYIIYYLSPVYVEREVRIELTFKKRISPEQLIGAVCGSVSVFFLVLGIIILAIRKHNEIINQYNEFDDISDSNDSECEIRQNIKETQEINQNKIQETVDNTDFWN